MCGPGGKIHLYQPPMPKSEPIKVSVRTVTVRNATYLRLEDVIALLGEVADGAETDTKSRLHGLQQSILRGCRDV